MQSIPHPNDAPGEFDYDWPAGFRDIQTDARTHARTDAGSSPIL